MKKETEINEAPAWYRKAMDVPYEDHMVNVKGVDIHYLTWGEACLLYTSPSPRDVEESRMPSSA